MLEQAGAALRKHGLQLVQLDIGSDAYCVVMVPIAHVAAVARLAKRAGYGEAKSLGDALAAAKRERVA